MRTRLRGHERYADMVATGRNANVGEGCKRLMFTLPVHSRQTAATA